MIYGVDRGVIVQMRAAVALEYREPSSFLASR